MSEFKIYYPTGFIGLVDDPPKTRITFLKPLDNSGFLRTGTGPFPIPGALPPNRGTLEVSITLGATGTARCIAVLVDKWPNPTQQVGILIDTNNRPFAYLSIDGLGTVYGQGSPSGAAYASGRTLRVRLSYDLRNFVHGASTALLEIEDQNQDWTTEPGLTSIQFQPTYLIVGDASVQGYSDFNRVVNWSQLAKDVETEPADENVYAISLSGDFAVAMDGLTIATSM